MLSQDRSTGIGKTMAVEIHVRKNAAGNLVPFGPNDAELLADLPQKVALKAKLSQPRSVPHNAKYWVMLKRVVDNQDLIPSTDVLHGLLMQRLGYATEYRLRDGSTYFHKGSTAFNRMTQQEYNLYYEKAVLFIKEFVIPGLDIKGLEEEIGNF